MIRIIILLNFNSCFYMNTEVSYDFAKEFPPREQASDSQAAEYFGTSGLKIRDKVLVNDTTDEKNPDAWKEMTIYDFDFSLSKDETKDRTQPLMFCQNTKRLLVLNRAYFEAGCVKKLDGTIVSLN